ncbi:WD40-repeat-containing domain protein [Schizothecium vesticola]|uniref:Probable cytosolic iron-sulfur protein assembly protein 1 n=1 Tax=Schizothecium vesticola TaxID=314040 RepID=A0AA40EJY0_9PEZI|nr:WD40-repeat-containing domain protein [Schizothecium vesticola]
MTTPSDPEKQPPSSALTPLPPFRPDLYQRAWLSIPHPTLPLLATAHATSVTIFSLANLTQHSTLTGGHARSVRSVAWQPTTTTIDNNNNNNNTLRLVTGSFDATAGVWSYRDKTHSPSALEQDVTGGDSDDSDEWEFNLVLEGHDNEIKSCAFNPAGNLLATCSRDKSIWIWEDVGGDGDDGGDWETVVVLQEHDADVKAIAWCPDVRGRNEVKGVFSVEVLASASYDDTVRIWREEDGEGEWACVAVLEGGGGTGGRFPRLVTASADGGVRIWEREEAEEEEDVGAAGSNPWGAIPGTVRREMREEWTCKAVLPRVHTRDVYSVAWSGKSGIVATTGSDGVMALYREEGNGWKLVDKVEEAHGPYEVNHVTWCKRWDAGTEMKGEEEMLVTTGDDGVVRPWQVRIA